ANKNLTGMACRASTSPYPSAVQAHRDDPKSPATAYVLMYFEGQTPRQGLEGATNTATYPTMAAPNTRLVPKYSLKQFEARLARHGFALHRLSGPLAAAQAARKTNKAAPTMDDPRLDLDLDLDLDFDIDNDSDEPNAPHDPTPPNDNGGNNDAAPATAKIIVHWCEKPKGSPSRGAAGYNLKKKLRMPTRSYRLVRSGIKLLLMRQPGIDMAASISFQDEDILRHVLKKAAKQYPEFDIFAKQGRWPLRAFAHTILRSSANQHQENSGQRQSKKEKNEAAVENPPPAVDESMRDDTAPLARIPPPVEGRRPQPTDELVRNEQVSILDESMRANESPFEMDLLGDDPRFHSLLNPNAEPLPEEPALPPGVFDEEEDGEARDHAVDKVLKDFGNVTLDSIDDEDVRAASPVAMPTTDLGQDESPPPARKPHAQAPTHKSTLPASLVAEPTHAPASHQSTAKDPPARAPTSKLSPSSANANLPASKLDPQPIITYRPRSQQFPLAVPLEIEQSGCIAYD
ncbi:hypothetical protein FRC06_001991, partial [Ceratobasidium sp. 370]